MLELLQMCLEILLGAGSLIWGAVLLILGSTRDILCHLHENMPRLEGLLVGISLAWLFLRRDKHPLLRVLSAPLKLVLDILDLAWDQCVEIVSDAWEVVTTWLGKAWGWSKSLALKPWNWLMGSLGFIKDKLKRKKE